MQPVDANETCHCQHLIPVLLAVDDFPAKLASAAPVWCHVMMARLKS